MATEARARLGQLTLLRLSIGLGAVLSPTVDAHAYTLKATQSGNRIRWMSPEVAFARIPSDTPSNDQLLSGALAGATNAWHEHGALNVRSTHEEGHVVRWSGSEWPHDPDYLAVTLVRYEVSSGAIQSAEVVINEPMVNWKEFDLQNTLTHEIGHALGLGHSDEVEAIMYATTEAGAPSRYVLSEDDFAALSELYGEPVDRSNEELHPTGYASPVSPDEFGCSSVRGAGPGEWFLFLGFVMLAFGSRFRRRASVVVATLVTLVASVATAHPSGAEMMSRLPARTELVIEGRIIGQHTEWRPGDLIVTVSRVQIDRCMFGDCPSELSIEQLGGEHGNLGLLVSGVSLLPARGRVLLAARSAGANWRLAGENRGQAYVERAPVGREDAGATLAQVRGRVQALLREPAPMACAPTPPAVPPTNSSSVAKGYLKQ